LIPVVDQHQWKGLLYFVDRFATTIWHIANGELTEDIRVPRLA
jgi:hypothetical protein